MATHLDRVVVLVDMDCFYCQVEENLNPELKGKPIAVVQYNAWRGGGLIAVNYPARDSGVTRHMRGDEAKEKCPDIELVKVPTVRGKADLTKYREAGKRVADVLKTFTPLLQRASIDEAYLDITEAVQNRVANTKNISIEDVSHTYIVDCTTEDFIKNVFSNDFNHEQNLKLLVGGVIVEEIRQAVYERTGYRCSAGIAHNKILAKLVCGMNKPNKQTILPHDRIESLYKTLPIKKIKSLGGKFGHTLSEDLNIKFMSELAQFSEKDLIKRYDEKTASWLYNIARGIDTEPVETRLISKSIGCCKRFPGKTALITLEEVKHWLSELSDEIGERLEQDLEENNRKAKQIVLSFAQEVNKKDVHSSRTQTLNSYDPKRILEDTLENLRKFTEKPDGTFHIKFLGLSAGKFDSIKKVNDISTFFKQIHNKKDNIDNKNESSKSLGKEIDMDKEHTNKNIKSKQKSNCLINFLNNPKSTFTTQDSEDDKPIKVDNIENEIVKNNQVDTNLEYPSKQMKSQINHNSELELSLNEIEKDADDSLDFMVHDKFLSTSTMEVDYKELLNNMKEYPYKLYDEYSSKQECEKNEVSTHSNNLSPILEQTEGSFIVRYFKQFATASTSSYNIPNTSDVNLEDTKTNEKISSDTEMFINQHDYDNDYSNSVQYNENKTPKEDDERFDNIDSVHSSESSQEDEMDICKECNERIPKSQLISHMDEHIALKLMEEEKRYFKQELETVRQKKLTETTKSKSPTKQKKLPSTSKSLKRKCPPETISSFFKSKLESIDTSRTETCPECNKQINLSEFISHLDFHAAKKLHLELNPVKNSSSTSHTSINKTDSKSNFRKSKNNNTSVQTLANFFKKI